MEPMSFIEPTDSRAIENAAKTTRFVTNFPKRKFMVYNGAIGTFEDMHPEYKDLLYISSDPADVVDAFGMPVEGCSALMLKCKDMINLSDFWNIVIDYEERLLHCI